MYASCSFYLPIFVALTDIVVDRAREQDLQSQDHMRRQLPRSATDCTIHIACQSAVCLSNRWQGRPHEDPCAGELDTEQQSRDLAGRDAKVCSHFDLELGG